MLVVIALLCLGMIFEVLNFVVMICIDICFSV
jgi:hypothetical protein